jgi:hypothetical protein
MHVEQNQPDSHCRQFPFYVQNCSSKCIKLQFVLFLCVCKTKLIQNKSAE